MIVLKYVIAVIVIATICGIISSVFDIVYGTILNILNLFDFKKDKDKDNSIK